MLNISHNSINDKVDRSKYSSFRVTESKLSGNVLRRILLVLLGITILTMFLPWTQNIRSSGKVTTLTPDQRPQAINSVIDGRIEQWFVREGDFVAKGDTIIHISEIKSEYFDPELLTRTQEQLSAKERSVVSYDRKVTALADQISALRQAQELKAGQARNRLEQVRLKLSIDSADLRAKTINLEIAQKQYDRLEGLYQDGLKSLTDLEQRRLNLQKAQAELISAQNKLGTTQNELLNAQIELNAIRASYQKEIAKAESDRSSAESARFDAESSVAKLRNQYANYARRAGMYFVTAPQDGYVTKAIQQGIGENIKAGDQIVTIMPSRYDLAIETYVEPMNLPLLDKGQHVRIQFDGWPAIVFSGWPNTSYGTYGGRIFAIDNFTSPNGMYRVMVEPDPNDHPWPDELRVGGGTRTLILLKDVPVWYELWRQINGFPPDYYRPGTDATPEPDKE